MHQETPFLILSQGSVVIFCHVIAKAKSYVINMADSDRQEEHILFFYKLCVCRWWCDKSNVISCCFGGIFTRTWEIQVWSLLTSSFIVHAIGRKRVWGCLTQLVWFDSLRTAITISVELHNGASGEVEFKDWNGNLHRLLKYFCIRNSYIMYCSLQ